MAPSQGSVHGTPTLQSSEPPPEVVYSRVGTPTAGGYLAVPPSGNNHQGLIALRAIHSVRSLARIGSWAQLKNMPPPDETTATLAMNNTSSFHLSTTIPLPPLLLVLFYKVHLNIADSFRFFQPKAQNSLWY